jgi:hypothetical protein
VCVGEPLLRFAGQDMLLALAKAGLIFLTGHVIFILLALFLAG